MDQFWYVTYDLETLTQQFQSTDFQSLQVAINVHTISNVDPVISNNSNLGPIQKFIFDVQVGLTEIVNDEIEYNKNQEKNQIYLQQLDTVAKFLQCDKIYAQLYWPYVNIPFFVYYRLTASLFRLEKALLYLRNSFINQKLIQASPYSFSLKALINKQQQSHAELYKNNPSYNRFNTNNYFVNININLLAQLYSYLGQKSNEIKKADTLQNTQFLNNQLRRIYCIVQNFVNLSQEDLEKENNLLNQDFLQNYIVFMQIEHQISSEILTNLLDGGNLVDLVDYQEKQRLLQEMSKYTNVEQLPRQYMQIIQKLIPNKFDHNQQHHNDQVMMKISQKLKAQKEKEKTIQQSQLNLSSHKQQTESVFIQNNQSFKKVQSLNVDKSNSENRTLASLHLQTSQTQKQYNNNEYSTPIKSITQKNKETHTAFRLDKSNVSDHNTIIKNFNEETVEQIKFKKSLANITASDILIANEIKKYKTMEKKGIQDKLQFVPAFEKPDNTLKDQSIFNEDEFDDQDDRIQLSYLKPQEKEQNFFDFMSNHPQQKMISNIITQSQKGTLFDQKTIFISKKQEGWERIRQFIKNRVTFNKVKRMIQGQNKFNIGDQIRLILQKN